MSSQTKAQKRKAKRKAQKALEEKDIDIAAEDEMVDEKEEEEARRQLEEAKKWLSGLSVEEVINKKYFEPETIEALSKSFHGGQPFKHLRLEDFLDPQFAERLKDELKTLDYYKKDNDLYQFAQSDDLKNIKLDLITKYREVLYSPQFRKVLRAITGIETVELSSEVSISSNVYEDGQTLLCHDDELQGRRIAYILYLVPEDWEKEDGGALDLFGVDKHLQPTTVQTSLVPKFNSFAFFEVSPVSYHQVAEVTSDKTRLTLTGWFHGEPIQRPEPYVEPPVTFVSPIANSAANISSDSKSSSLLDEWVNREYRKARNIKQVNQTFSDESNIELADFLRKDKFDLLIKELTSEATSAQFKPVGPPNKRHYSELALSTTSDSKEAETSVAQQLFAFMHSQEFADFLTELTGLTVRSVHGEVRRFGKGDYTLAHDEDEEMKQGGLDVVLMGLKPRTRWTTDMGGQLVYLMEGEEEELLTVWPRSNTLAIVFRSAEGGTMRFVKYINHRAASDRFDYNFVYRVDEFSDDEDEEDEEEEEEEEPVKAPAKKSATKK